MNPLEAYIEQHQGEIFRDEAFLLARSGGVLADIGATITRGEYGTVALQSESLGPMTRTNYYEKWKTTFVATDSEINLRPQRKDMPSAERLKELWNKSNLKTVTSLMVEGTVDHPLVTKVTISTESRKNGPPRLYTPNDYFAGHNFTDYSVRVGVQVHEDAARKKKWRGLKSVPPNKWYDHITEALPDVSCFEFKGVETLSGYWDMLAPRVAIFSWIHGKYLYLTAGLEIKSYRTTDICYNALGPAVRKIMDVVQT
jgi:hypothetical protein